MSIKAKFKIIFFLVLAGYAVILATLPYVSVYYTYFAIPALAISALFGFGSINNPKLTSALIFIVTLVAWLVTLVSVSYVGVYLTSIVLPILGLSALGFVMADDKG